MIKQVRIESSIRFLLPHLTHPGDTGSSELLSSQLFRCPSVITTSQEPLGQLQPKLVGNMIGGWRFRFVQIKVLATFGAK